MTAYFDVPKFETIVKCAEITGLAKYRIRKFILEGKLKYIRAGTKYLINIESLIDYTKSLDSDYEKIYQYNDCILINDDDFR